MELPIQPIERDAYVVDLAATFVVRPFAESSATKVEAQHRKSERIERLHGMEDDLVMHRPAEKRVRMADKRGMSGVGSTLVQQGFETAGRTVEKKATDLLVRGGQAFGRVTRRRRRPSARA